MSTVFGVFYFFFLCVVAVLLMLSFHGIVMSATTRLCADVTFTDECTDDKACRKCSAILAKDHQKTSEEQFDKYPSC